MNEKRSQMGTRGARGPIRANWRGPAGGEPVTPNPAPARSVQVIGARPRATARSPRAGRRDGKAEGGDSAGGNRSNEECVNTHDF